MVSPTTQRTVSPAETETSFSPGSRRDVGDLVDGGVELVERALGVGIDLDGIDVAVLDGLDAGGRVGAGDALLGRALVLLLSRPPSAAGFSWPGSGNGFGTSTYSTGGFGSGSRLAALKAGLSRMGISGTCDAGGAGAERTASARLMREPSGLRAAHFGSPAADVLRPVEGVHVDAERVLAHRLDGARRA